VVERFERGHRDGPQTFKSGASTNKPLVILHNMLICGVSVLDFVLNVRNPSDYFRRYLRASAK
jgi:hypothetical protein